ncbi:uncharacterized protein LOC106643231 isoform X2 [Copidosoma floridanum]|uniref:uncharacterized protein LOC106643231 isoform X2 n=1 Tax=Copidosoma floridanum TaxID=29053 RepID=UPI0006C97DC8|nr:uncharacterized protein LOC106643231 isoform X2 [Copidosoma floridanum]
MSHSVTIQTRTVTTGSPSSINVGFCKSWAGLLKIAQVVVGLVVVLLVLYGRNEKWINNLDIFLMLVAFAFMLGTAIFIISYFFSPVSEPIIGKTNYDIIYNGSAVLLLLIGSIVSLSESNPKNSVTLLLAGVFGLIMALLYAASLGFLIRRKI